MVIHFGFVRVLRGLLARFVRRTLRETGRKPVFRDSLEAYPPIPLRLPPRALRLCVSLPGASRWRGTGWKPVFHDRLEAYPPAVFPLGVLRALAVNISFQLINQPINQ